MFWPNQSPGANRHWRCQLRIRGSRRRSAVAQISTLGGTLQLCKGMKVSSLFVTMYLMALLVSGCGKAQQAEPVKSALHTAVDRLQRQFWETHPYLEGRTPDQWEQSVLKCADTEDYAVRFLTLAKAHPNTRPAEESLWWIIAYCPQAPSCKEAVEILWRDYSQNFPSQCRGLIQPAAPYGDSYFRAIIEKSSSRQMQGQAMLARARFRQTVMRDNATAEKLLEQVAEQYADIPVGGGRSITLGEIAKDDLINLRNPNLVQNPLGVGRKAPPFEATTTDGKTIKFPDTYKGKVVLLDFWATWCGPCVKEIPNVVDAYEKFHSEGLEVLSVSLDQENASRILAEFVKKHRMPWPQIYDGKYLDSTIARRYGIDGIPHALVVDGDTGLILADAEGARGPELATAIKIALAARRSPPK
jgi:peroxiredoxin